MCELGPGKICVKIFIPSVRAKMPMLNSVTLTRSRRPNAGSRMARLLNEEEEDDFYQSAYGGFAEVSIP